VEGPRRFIRQRELPPFLGTPEEDATDFIDRFERTTLGWSEEDRKNGVGHYFGGDALNWLRALENITKNEKIRNSAGEEVSAWVTLTWAEFKGRMENSFGGEERALRLIYGKRQGKEEASLSYYFDILARISKHLSSVPEKDQVYLIRTGLRPEVDRYLWDKRVKTREELEYYLGQHDLIRQEDDQKEKGLAETRAEETALASITNKMQRLVEHFKVEDLRIRHTSNPERRRLCYRCRQPGHLAQDCTPTLKGASQTRICYRCRKYGHLASDCSSKEPAAVRATKVPD
jgi:hypothetical protein